MVLVLVELPLVLVGAEEGEAAVAPPAAVERLDESEEGAAQAVVPRPGGAVEKLGLQEREEGLCHGVISRRAAATHAANDAAACEVPPNLRLP